MDPKTGSDVNLATVDLVDPPPLCPSLVFKDAKLVVVGGTGFLGKVWVSMLLHRFPDVGKLYLLVRAKPGQTPDDRFWAQIATSPTFDPLREKYPGDKFEAFLREKITPVAGDMVHPDLGLSAELIGELSGRVGAVVNVAGVVDFNPPLDDALDVNAFGVNNLVSLAQKLGAPVMHTSTCFVAGYRSGLIEEIDPRAVPFPRAAGERVLGETLPETSSLDRSHWDPQREIDECIDLVKTARHRCEDAFRQSHFLDQAKQNLGKRGEPERGSALEDELAKVKRNFIKDQLIDAGMERARFWGWSNIYTYTKSIGEQVLASSGVPFTIVRPAVVESSVEYPFKGWNEGINTSAPFIFMALKGQVQFPGASHVHLDIIPVDMVAAGMIASLAELMDGRAPAVYQYGCTDTNPCKMQRYLELIGLYKRKSVFDGKRTSVMDFVSSRFNPQGLNKEQYEKHGAHAIAGAMRGLSKVLRTASIGPAAAVFKPASKALMAAAKTEDKTGEIMDLFIPFTAEVDWVFACTNTRAAFNRMPEDERKLFIWWPESIDWRWWMFEAHMPGLEKWVVPHIEEKMKRELKPLRSYDTLLDVLDEAATRHDYAVGLSKVEDEGLSRVTYHFWRNASYALGMGLARSGVKPGDRVLLSGLNQPAWAIAYFGILRAGAVAVPVDPGLEGDAIANIIRSSHAKVAIWDAEVEERAGQVVRAAHPSLQVVDLLEATDFSDSEAAAAQELRSTPAIAGTDIASIIYTSGTTGEPKGVMLSHRNFTSLLAAITPLFPLNANDRVLSVLPLHHTFEFTCGLLLPLSCGTRIVYVRELNADGLSEGLKHQITGMVGVPALWQLLERRILSRVKEQGPAATTAFHWGLELNKVLGQKLGLNAGRLLFAPVHKELGGKVRHLISGGAALPQDTAKLFNGIGLPMAEGYGLTEAAPVLTVAKASVKSRPGNVGKALPGVEIKIHEPDSSGVGEVLARGPNVMVGYADDEAATRLAIDEDGWLHTGDLGKFDKRDRLVIVGRNKDVIVNASGENVYPDDVENSIGSVSNVRELAIVGVDDDRGGERVGCLAVPEAAADPELESPSDRQERHQVALASLRKAFEKLPRVAQPAVVQLYETDLPRTATRKVKRPEVRDILERMVTATATPPPSDDPRPVTIVRQAIAGITNRDPASITATTDLRAELNFDSLMTMELTVALEAQLGRGIDGSLLNQCETVGDIERLAGRRIKQERHAQVEEAEEEPIRLPESVSESAKDFLTKFQYGFYGRVMRPKVIGRAYIPHNRNTIVASNHSSHLDMGFVKYALGTYGHGMVSLAAADYFFKSKWRRAYFDNLTNLAAFDRKNGLRQGLRQAGDLLEQGKTVLLFPEGTRSTDGVIREFKPAIGHLALVQGVDILPVYLGGTYEAMPKGSRFPVKRQITARIGMPLEVSELRRLTEGMKFSNACRKVAELAHLAVSRLKEGKVLDLREIKDADETPAPTEHPMVGLFRELESRFVTGRVQAPLTFYFTLGNEKEAKWTLEVGVERCAAKLGKPDGQADCVLKTSQEIFTRIVREAYTPSPVEFMSGAIKSNDIGLLQTFQKVFDLA